MKPTKRVWKAGFSLSVLELKDPPSITQINHVSLSEN
jgi:hypothetical protein